MTNNPNNPNIAFKLADALRQAMSKRGDYMVAGDLALSEWDALNAPPQREHPEPNTVAFMAIGALDAWNSATKEQRERLDLRSIGQCEFVDDVIAYALTVDRAADPVTADNGWTGVFAYEVAESVGHDIAQAMLEGRISDAYAWTVITQAIKECSSVDDTPAWVPPAPDGDVVLPPVGDDGSFASYGARVLLISTQGEHVEPCGEDDTPAFWSVYAWRGAHRWQWVRDTDCEQAARAHAEAVARGEA